MVVKEVKLPASAKTITVVGMGMSPEDLSEKALSVIKKADILIGGKRHLGCFSTLPVQKIPIYKNLKEILKIITASAKKNKKVVVLASGDPGYHGIAHYLVTHLGKQRITILPNITTFQAAFAKIKENWDDAFLLSLHGKPIPRMASLLKKHRKMGLLTDHKNTPGRIAKSVLTEDASLKNTPVFILEKLGTQEEKIHKYLLKNVVKKTFASLNVMIFISPSGDERAGEGTRLGIPDNLFSRQGELITKNDIRVLTLAKLNLPKQGVFWDIGSGSGSVAIEAAGLSPELEIVAIEKYEKRIDDIRKNIRKFHAEGTITPILGEAPQILKKLPKPHRIFVGGTEGALLAVLRYCRRALLPSGKIVINAATIETVNETMAFFDKIGWPSEVTLLNISRMKKIGNRGRLQPLNPVFVIEGSKPADNR
jgi:precorrin-6Y C5,15-methyltransferase (decarboxylating)